MQVRRAVVAGQFYPSDIMELRDAIEDCFVHRLGPGKLPPSNYTTEGNVICIAPHAGYQYSGPVAANTYMHVSSLKKPETAVIVGPNHYGIGSGISSYKNGVWETPLGRVKVDRELVESISEKTGILDFDEQAHKYEHSIEVQIPFIQYLYGNSIKIVPICIAFQDIETAKILGKGIAEAIRGKSCILVASSDLTHYEEDESARKKDRELLKAVEKLDIDLFYTSLHRLNVTACGYGAIGASIVAARELGFVRGEILKYATSGDITQDLSSVVGYPSVRFVKP
jgi:AmmeMemoRadiSam system protein B